MLIIALPTATDPRKVSLVARVAQLAPSHQAEVFGPLIVALTPQTRRHSTARGRRFFTAQDAILDRRASAKLGLAAAAREVERIGEDALSDYAAPYWLAWAEADGLEATATADHCGLGALFGWSGPGLACISDSAALLGRLFGLAIDTAALAGYALAGSFVGQDSPVQGVRKLSPGHRFVLSQGRLSERLNPPARQLTGGSGEETLRATLVRYAEAFPEADVEVSGGWDSRLLLAAIPAPVRASRCGFTLGAPGEPDHDCAQRICQDQGMRQVVVDLAAHLEPDADGLDQLLRDGAETSGFGSNPLDRAILIAANRSHRARARFSGQNGEILRGFYYPGQPLEARPSRKLAEALVHWRILVNDLADSSLFEREWFRDQKATIVRRLVDQLATEGESWAATLDRFYVTQRMQRWLGPGVSSVLEQRNVAMPFFDEDVLALSRRTPAKQKQGNRFVARLITNLAPELARLPLESGLSPRQVSEGGPAVKFSELRRKANKFRRKILQRVLGGNGSAFGSTYVMDLYERCELYRRYPVDKVAELEMFDAGALQAFAQGRLKPNRPSLGVLLNAAYLSEFLSSEGADVSAVG